MFTDVNKVKEIAISLSAKYFTLWETFAMLTFK